MIKLDFVRCKHLHTFMQSLEHIWQRIGKYFKGKKQKIRETKRGTRDLWKKEENKMRHMKIRNFTIFFDW